MDSNSIYTSIPVTYFSKYVESDIILLYRSKKRRTTTHKYIIDDLMSTLSWCDSAEEALHCYKNKIISFPRCPECKSKRKFRTNPFVYIVTCGGACKDIHGHKSKDYKEIAKKTKQTCLERYGVDNFRKSKEFKLMREDNKSTWEPRRIERMKEAFVAKFNSESPFGSKEVRDKSKLTLISNYGVDNYAKSEENRNRVRTREENELRYNNTISSLRANYNDDTITSPMQIESVKQKAISTRLERYGCAWPMQNYDSLVKNKKNGFQLKEYIDNLGVTHYLQGYEPQVFEILTNAYDVKKLDSDCNLLPRIILPNQSRYYPDLFDIENKIIYEVKGTYTFDNDADKIRMSFDAVTNLGFTYIVCLYQNGYICFINSKDQIK